MRYAAHLAAVHIRRRHRRIALAKAAQQLSKRLEAATKHPDASRARHHTAAWAQTKHLLGLVVGKLHRSAAVLLPVERHLDAHAHRRPQERGRCARQIRRAHKHGAHLEVPKPAPIVRPRGEPRPAHHDERSSRSWAAGRPNHGNSRLRIHTEHNGILRGDALSD